MELLKFSPGKSNAKLASLGKKVYTFSLPSGHTCPGANECLAKVFVKDGKVSLEDGPKMRFRCFSATQEAAFPAVRMQRQHNFDVINSSKDAFEMAEKIEASLPKDASVIRIHVAGDFYSKNYMMAWILVAKAYPKITFYAYTKSINFWMALKNEIPDNLKMNASVGGKYDKLIDKNNLKFAKVVYSEQEAADQDLEIDHDDSHAFLQDKSFAMLLHGVQPKGSEAADALKLLKKADIGQYHKTKKHGDQDSPSR